MFSKKDFFLFAIAALLLITGFALIAFDEAENGFGISTLWIAPPLLVTGFMLPVAGIVGIENLAWPRLRGLKISEGIPPIPFVASLVMYLYTLEPTASLWDCSEFIASAYKLQVPHTPGTPLSLLIARLFTMLALDNVAAVAWTINFMSAFFSSMAVLMCYLIISHLGRRLVPEGTNCFIVPLSSLTGSLCLAYSDTFWFSAVEAETYAAACFFLLLLVWLILTGRALNGARRSRRLVLIFYIAGLAYCIHPMCLLALPLLPLSWYNPNHKLDWKKTVLLISAGLLLVLFINRFIAVGVFEMAFVFDLFFVNKIHLPFYSGVLILLLAFVFLSLKALKKWSAARPYIWSLIFLLSGFTPYLLLFLRSNHNPPIDETNPENLALIKAYMNRESYPASPLLYGPYFDARIVDFGVKKKIYYKDTHRYEVAGTLPEYHYNSRQTLLPRMYSNDPEHIRQYRLWTGLGNNDRPDFADNLRFMFTYQLGHMYFRYLLWNFAGRAGEIQNSDWLRPWESVDALPFEKARNQYWMIPLLLGICGAIFQWRRDRNSFLSIAALFFVTGVVLAIYINAPPNEPRERDYIYVGSFMAFSIWIGLGAIALGMLVNGNGWRVIFLGFMIAIPLWILYQNYDDHNRSGRRLQVDNARNILGSCARNSILFTGGDNDTFPLWYLQEVEGFRTDVRVMVLSYMNTDWYINQLRKGYYNSPAFQFSLDEKDYRQYGANDVIYVQEAIPDEIDLTGYLRLLKNDHPALTKMSQNGEPYHILPSRSLSISVPDWHGVGTAADNTKGVPLRLHIDSDYIGKNVLAILDLLVSNGWQRTIYFNYTSLGSLGVDIRSYVVEEGPVFRLRATRNDSGSIAVDTSMTYANIIQRADYSNIEDPTVHFSYEDHFARIIVPIRQSFNDLAKAFLAEGNATRAREVMSKAIDQLYGEHLQPSYTNIEAAEILLSLNEQESASRLCKVAYDYYLQKGNAERQAGRNSSDLDDYLVHRSAELLAKIGTPAYRGPLPSSGVSDD